MIYEQNESTESTDRFIYSSDRYCYFGHCEHSFSKRQKKQFALDLWGNVLQATGNALEADAETPDTLGVYGNEIQAIGSILCFLSQLEDRATFITKE